MSLSFFGKIILDEKYSSEKIAEICFLISKNAISKKIYILLGENTYIFENEFKYTDINEDCNDIKFVISESPNYINCDNLFIPIYKKDKNIDVSETSILSIQYLFESILKIRGIDSINIYLSNCSLEFKNMNFIECEAKEFVEKIKENLFNNDSWTPSIKMVLKK